MNILINSVYLYKMHFHKVKAYGKIKTFRILIITFYKIFNVSKLKVSYVVYCYVF